MIGNELHLSSRNCNAEMLRRTAFEVMTEYLNSDWLVSDQGAIMLRSELAAGVSSGKREYAMYKLILSIVLTGNSQNSLLNQSPNG